MKLAVIGTGYVGLVSGTCFAETGNQVTCVDIDESKINRLKSGKLTIYEPGLQVLFERNIKQERLLFTTNLEEAIKDAEIIFLALPTPPGEDGSADLSYVLGVAEQLGKMITDYKVIVDKSTVPVGTAERVHAAIAANAKTEFDVVSNPEFLREGVAVDDFMKPDRVVVGTSSDRAKKVMEKLYNPYVRQGNPVIFMDERSAEMTKYAANSYLATRISFMNEIANICELVGANVDFVRKGMGSDNRIGQRFLFAGVGYGGSCFPKDVQALERTANENKYEFNILSSVMKVNERQKVVMVDKIKSFYGEDLTGKHFAMWGLAFKPNTDDIREAPALYIINELLAAGATVATFDPEAMENVLEQYEGDDRVSFEENQYNALKNADALIIVTEWSVFRTPDFEKTFSIMKDRVIFDGRNVFDLEQMEELKTYYNSIGRQAVDTREKKQVPQEA
ncbi:nucleotide sugar dehydrogenase [Bernardetia litoralis DSM 6794]|uniref:UDP-glucose 6-dehydrogenase n=1 Tax=Bernardetia litoralis (strain ATCC 23117 / DSM 6794 / NBRC 15988 / NCIMB 1366 / Fx l1 / Sio-4) TaxID=880071 RepID=I4ANN3_BERLS|nr:UDP-glucose/GDP-mannose dehydrogenase family protein [Bernardetia litoralis]AFM05568.1 nucleotide sugar dehydrogenase [Bernardetia litoralis DSM 6794]